MRLMLVGGGLFAVGLGCGGPELEEPVAPTPAPVAPTPRAGATSPPSDVLWADRTVSVRILNGQGHVWGIYPEEGEAKYFVSPVDIVIKGTQLSFDVPQKLSLRDQDQSGSTEPFGSEVGVTKTFDAHISGTIKDDGLTLRCTGKDCWWTTSLTLGKFSIPND